MTIPTQMAPSADADVSAYIAIEENVPENTNSSSLTTSSWSIEPSGKGVARELLKGVVQSRIRKSAVEAFQLYCEAFDADAVTARWKRLSCSLDWN
jgi:hypothetical protein